MGRSAYRLFLILLLVSFGLMWPRAVAAAGGGADEIAAMARAAAREDRNSDSAELFLKAISQAPERRMEWLRELADQLTYSSRAREAVPLYMEVLAAGPEAAEEKRARAGLALALSWSGSNRDALREYDTLYRQYPGDTAIRLDRARVLSWLGENGRAKEAYSEILLEEPANAQALKGLAQVQSWRGKHRDAQRRLLAYLADHPDDSEAVIMLAQAQAWMGRQGKAERTLTKRLPSPPEEGAARRLLDEIRLRQRPDTRVYIQYSDQSDNLRISTAALEQNFSLNSGRTTLGPRYGFIDYDAGEEPAVDIHVHRPGVFARHRVSDAWETTGYFFVDFTNPDAGHTAHTTPTYDVYITHWPNDDFRFDAGSRRVGFDNTKSLLRDITAYYLSLSMDWLPGELNRCTLRFDQGFYSDGNERTWAQAELERRLLGKPSLYAGWRLTFFDFSEQLDNGYFNPDSYLSNSLTVRSWMPIGERLHLNMSGAAGIEQAEPDGDKFIWDLWVNLNYRVARAIELEAAMGYLSSATASSGGFERGTARLGLHAVW